ncbi:MAG: cytochrome c3 family protein [Anaerolineae bacterium]
MSTRKRYLITLLLGVGITLILVGLTPLVAAHAQETTPEPETTPEAEATAAAGAPEQPAIVPTGDNGYCMICHNIPWRTVTLADDNLLNLYVSSETVAGSVHGEHDEEGALGCLDCHGENAFPHSGPTPVDRREYRLQMVQTCFGCHEEQQTGLINGLHEEAIAAGNTGAAVCTDCHGAHDVQRVAAQPGLVAGICGDCHVSTLAEWRDSPHLDIGPLGCATCHSPHTQRLRVGADTTALCLNCHNSMPDTFVHNQHLADSQLMQCADCHMFAEPAPADIGTVNVSSNVVLMPTGHSMRVETVACNTCHEELVASGEWATLTGEAETTSADASSQTEVVSAENDEAVTNYVQLIQGLILGIGFGITGAAIFITRGNRQGNLTAPQDK